MARETQPVIITFDSADDPQLVKDWFEALFQAVFGSHR